MHIIMCVHVLINNLNFSVQLFYTARYALLLAINDAAMSI